MLKEEAGSTLVVCRFWYWKLLGERTMGEK